MAIFNEPLLTVIRRKFNGFYDRLACRAVRMIEAVEERFMFDTGVRTVIVWPSAGGWYVHKSYRYSGSCIKVPAHKSPNAFASYVYHEMAHAIFDRYELKSFLSPFTRRRQVTWYEYLSESGRAASYERQNGYVSGYARCNREEDFCETVAAYLMHPRSWHSRIVYENEAICVRYEPRLRRKLDSVHEMFRSLRHFE